MSNFRIAFLYPWLLLLFIPAIGVILWLYLRLSKKYRRTRNRIISLMLQVIVMILSISVLTGATFNYKQPNLKNELMLVVDASFSNTGSQEEKNKFVESVLNESDSIFQIGVVIFANGYEYAAELSYDTNAVYAKYTAAIKDNELDNSATDIASALDFAARQFANKKTAKILLISDGIETDGSALSVIAGIVSEGIRVDTAFFPDTHSNEIQLVDIVFPTDNIIIGEPCNIGATVQSSYAGLATLTLFDNGVQVDSGYISITGGFETFSMEHTFTKGFHEICFAVKQAQDTVSQNNLYYSYISVDSFDNILIVDKSNESDKLTEILAIEYNNVEVVNLENVPTTQDALRQYDEVILVNISNEEMPDGFDLLLYDYVHKFGGGLLTVGGNKVDANGNPVLIEVELDGKTVYVPEANAYNRDDMKGTKYQEMLPVECIDYTPPLALMIILDRSGSMAPPHSNLINGKSMMDLAKEGAAECVRTLTERDYVGVISFAGGNDAREDIRLTPQPQRELVLDAISNIEAFGGTVYTNALKLAGEALLTAVNVERRHIIFITDGAPEDKPEEFEKEIKHYYENAGITLSAFGIGKDGVNMTVLNRMADFGNGGNGTQNKGRSKLIEDITELGMWLREDLNVPQIKANIPGEFTPAIKDRTAFEVRGFSAASIPLLGGFYGVKTKTPRTGEPGESLVIPLTGEYSPVYARWKFGKGRVGSFMCDLNGVLSGSFISDEKTGMRIINNIVRALLPMESIRPQDIEAEIKYGNYSNQIDIKTFLAEGDTLKVTVTGPSSQIGGNPLGQVLIEPTTQTLIPETSEGFPRCVYEVYQPGIYTIEIQKTTSQGEVIEMTMHTVFSYSKEYNVFVNDDDSLTFLSSLAQRSNGKVITQPKDALNAVKVVDVSKNPKIPFIIAAIVLFLLDIAVRKFKFKWPWEIINDRKERKLLKHGKN